MIFSLICFGHHHFEQIWQRHRALPGGVLNQKQRISCSLSSSFSILSTQLPLSLSETSKSPSLWSQTSSLFPYLSTLYSVNHLCFPQNLPYQSPTVTFQTPNLLCPTACRVNLNSLRRTEASSGMTVIWALISPPNTAISPSLQHLILATYFSTCNTVFYLATCSVSFSRIVPCPQSNFLHAPNLICFSTLFDFLSYRSTSS